MSLLLVSSVNVAPQHYILVDPAAVFGLLVGLATVIGVIFTVRAFYRKEPPSIIVIIVQKCTEEPKSKGEPKREQRPEKKEGGRLWHRRPPE